MFQTFFSFTLLLLVFNLQFSTPEALDAHSEVFDARIGNYTNEISEKPFKWLKNVQHMIGSPSGRIVVQVAKELLNRSAGNSQVRSEVVLSLNLTNLLIVLLLKVLIFTAGVFGAGHWNGGYGYGHNYARSLSTGSVFGVREGEEHLITAFLIAQGSGMDDCLFSAACSHPKEAQEYSRAAKALLETVEKLYGSPITNPRYKDMVNLIEKGIFEGFQGSDCKKISNCETSV